MCYVIQFLNTLVPKLKTKAGMSFQNFEVTLEIIWLISKYF